jgi:non-ribosomal peptide synthase protein (TIGR01720 family)
VRIELQTEDPGEALKSVKEQLRRIPNRGLTYGLLRYLSNDPQVTDQLRTLPEAEVGFNYLGQYAASPALESSGSERSGRAGRRHLLEINAAISGGRLWVQLGYSERHHRPATIERLAGSFIEHLGALIAHCCSRQAVVFTPSDFAQAGISQKDLDKLVAAVSPSERRGP